MKSQPEPDPPGENVPPALAAFLAQQRDFITKRWIEAVRRNDTLVAAEAKRDAEAHGEHRWQ